MDVIAMPSSFLVACFVNDYAPVVDHNLCLYGMHFPLARIVHLLSSPVFRTWYLLFCAVCEGYKAREMPFSLWGCSSLLVTCTSFGVLVHTPLTSDSIFCISLQMLQWSKSNKKPANVWVMQRRQQTKSIRNLFFVSSLKCLPAPISPSLSFLLDKRCTSCLSYFLSILL
jgi:hypothetical protein